MSDEDLIDGELRLDGRTRTFTLRLPRTPASRPMPLVLALHGRFEGVRGGPIMRQWTTFDEQADRWGWTVAYPDGVDGCWADGRGVTAADEAGIDDVAFLSALVDWSAERHDTFGDRTVVAGISNGAFMAHRLALHTSDRVAVVATVAGELPAAFADVEPGHAVSAMLIHGTADRYSPIDGGWSRHRGPNGEPRGRTLSLAETAEHWRAIDRCPPGPGETATTERSTRTAWDGGATGSRVVAWTVFGGGHVWPGMPVPPEWPEPAMLEFDGAEEICRFAEPLLASADDRRF